MNFKRCICSSNRKKVSNIVVLCYVFEIVMIWYNRDLTLAVTVEKFWNVRMAHCFPSQIIQCTLKNHKWKTRTWMRKEICSLKNDGFRLMQRNILKVIRNSIFIRVVIYKNFMCRKRFGLHDPITNLLLLHA